MERQWSFSVKSPTTVVILSSTISSSLLFCFLFSYWFLNYTPPDSREYLVQLSGGPAGLSFGKDQVFAASNSSLFANGSQDDILVESLLGTLANFSLEAPISGNGRKDEILVDASWSETDLSSGEVLNSDGRRKDDSVGGAHFRRTSNYSRGPPDLAEESNVTLSADASRKESSGFSGEALASITVEIETEDHSFSNKEAKKEEALAETPSCYNSSYNASGQNVHMGNLDFREEDARNCDVFDGRWVFDDSYPLYSSSSCSFIDEGFSCEANGRMDRNYTKWRWQPNDCDTLRFNPVKMLELIRGKRLVFIGDSINRNQWESMLCLLTGAISDPSRVYEARGRRIMKNKGNYNFKFPDYDCSVEFYVSHYLVLESKAKVRQRRLKTLRLDTIDRGSSRWRGADILVFNTAHWWSHHKTKAGLNYYQEGNQVHPHLDVSAAFRKALMTWASWVDQHATPGKTKVFFRSSSPSHFSGGEWNSGGHCKESNQPLNYTSGRQVPEKNLILQQAVKQMRTPVTILNITNLSGLRIDGHPSIYGRNPGRGPPTSIQDCSHWCLPGVPDTWNELLYFHLLSKRNGDSAR